ncbi:MAG: fumarylacetoacetate hydrolase family protein [Phaeodactylibacter sp.]|nr:fumarylacetoacetate hydrolase family protein [Phaeodactylibacter sp.]MCB9276572.1 fumarylacetoacetate hydrolase family protein [Lewinellaceae bacterium]
MKIICIGRNYAEHAKELNNPLPTKPVVFLKPATALLVNNKPLYYPEFTSELHYELEIVLKIAKNGRHVQPEFASDYYKEIALGIDFTARDLQQECKEKGLPWEVAKAFDGSAVLSPFVPVSSVNRQAIEFELRKNGKAVQHGNTQNLIFSFEEIIVYVSRFFKLQMGDLIYTGTPAGVGPVQVGDKLDGYLYTHQEVMHLLRCEVK